jgi:pyridoxamine 5'-phosphate oxidase family protein
MTAFTETELVYLRSQRLARLATADASGAPHVVPIGFRVSDDGAAIEVGGWGFGTSKKYRDAQSNPRVAIVIDDLDPVTGGGPRGLEVRGRAELHETGGERFGRGGDPQWMRIVPERISTWGIEAPAFAEGGMHSRTVEKPPPPKPT